MAKKTGLALIDSKINTFTTNKAKLQTLGHEIAMLIFDHAKEHGDTSRGLSLAKNLPKSWKAQLEDWFAAYSPIRVITKNDKHGFDPKYKKMTDEEKAAAWKRDEANATPFFMLEEPDVADKTYDFAALVKMYEQLGNRIEKMGKDGKIAEADADSAKLIVDHIKSTKFERAASTPANDPNKVTLSNPMERAKALVAAA